MTASQTASATAHAAARWWAEQLANPTFRTTSREEDLADLPGSLAEAAWERDVLHTLADRHPVTPEQLENFAKALEESILANTDPNLRLSVDYHPSRVLAEAARVAGIHQSRFPLKTCLWLNRDGTVTARLGYAGRERLIWSPPGWVSPPCGAMRSVPDPGCGWHDRRFLPELCGRPVYHDDACGDWVPDTRTCRRCGHSEADHHNADVNDPGFSHSFESNGAWDADSR